MNIQLMRRGFAICGALAVALVLAGCGVPGRGGASESTTITIGTDADADLQFVPSSVDVPANTPVTLTFNNTSTQPHNLQIPPPIAAKTKLFVAAGESDTFTFTAPAAGSYKFMCSLHEYMVGELQVK